MKINGRILAISIMLSLAACSKLIKHEKEVSGVWDKEKNLVENTVKLYYEKCFNQSENSFSVSLNDSTISCRIDSPRSKQLTFKPHKGICISQDEIKKAAIKSTGEAPNVEFSHNYIFYLYRLNKRHKVYVDYVFIINECAEIAMIGHDA